MRINRQGLFAALGDGRARSGPARRKTPGGHRPPLRCVSFVVFRRGRPVWRPAGSSSQAPHYSPRHKCHGSLAPLLLPTPSGLRPSPPDRGSRPLPNKAFGFAGGPYSAATAPFRKRGLGAGGQRLSLRGDRIQSEIFIRNYTDRFTALELFTAVSLLFGIILAPENRSRTAVPLYPLCPKGYRPLENTHRRTLP